jgi:hypothetical protein
MILTFLLDISMQTYRFDSNGVGIVLNETLVNFSKASLTDLLLYLHLARLDPL